MKVSSFIVILFWRRKPANEGMPSFCRALLPHLRENADLTSGTGVEQVCSLFHF
jgi:hypothetical protein